MGRLDGRAIVITGAGRGIGAALARICASEGAAVLVNDLGSQVDGQGADTGPAQEVVDEIVAAGGTAVVNFGDVGDHGQAEGIIQSAIKEFGQLDVLINVAGILRDRMIFNMTEQEWDDVIRVHLKGTFNMTKFASIYWRQERAGNYRLINFAAGSALHGGPGQPNYAAAKMGIVGLTNSCSRALAGYGVTANCISPGADTRMAATIPQQKRASTKEAGGILSTPPDRMAPLLVWLSSTASQWCTGQIFQAAGDTIDVYNTLQRIHAIESDGPWQFDDLYKRMESEMRPIVETNLEQSKFVPPKAKA